MKLLINYANAQYTQSQKLNSKTGLAVAGFDKVISYRPRDIDKFFFLNNAEILSQKEGNGYWLWKPYFIHKSLHFLHDGDFLFYCDSGSYFIGSIQPLIDICSKTGQDVVVFDVGFVEKNYTKRDAFIILNSDTADYTDSIQRLGSFILVRRSKFSIEFISTFLEYAQDKRLITDMDNVMGYPDYEGFIAHRHDQSILSLLSKKHGLESFRDPSQYGNRVMSKYSNSSYEQLINHTRDKNLPFYRIVLHQLRIWADKII